MSYSTSGVEECTRTRPPVSDTPRPHSKPADPRFSSGPCRKHPGWDLSRLDTSLLGRSHRAAPAKKRLLQAIERSARLIDLPADWKLGIVPGSDTGAMEMAMWSMLGERPVDALVWDAFSADWAEDIAALSPPQLNVIRADYGQLPDLTAVNSGHDIVFAFNGTTSGVCVPDLDWIEPAREGLVVCDATSAAFARPLDFSRLDVVTWSWQKILGGEAAHGMLALSPRAVSRLQTRPPARALPKLFSLTRKGKLIDGIFAGATINTPSMLALEDLHSALDWADSEGGVNGLQQRTDANFAVIDDWLQTQDWIDWLATEPDTRSHTAMCLRITTPLFTSLDGGEQQAWIDRMAQWLEQEDVACDIANYRSAPPGFRLWGGPTVDTTEFRALTPWLEWAYRRAEKQILEEHSAPSAEQKEPGHE